MDENTTQSILQRLTKIETLLEVDYSHLETRVSKLEGNGTWLWRTIGGVIIGAIGVLIFK
ncbi:hemolysin XhlA [Clostridium sp.]|uniref:hemolysin XhlA n=1 Tax=Clostridium sp. TaxID=1506 RepID=UPI00262187C2|nr:hemolysin XhlA [Clostridium sp.]